ncbi:MAG: hypothetical protein JWL77_4994 [Chthonomonadaceae bacterium]|nr:hypothetical protein [Chthonomonadaceae bacterium]
MEGNPVKKARLLLVGASALALWGCGGSGGGPVGNSNALVDGRAALTQLATNTTSPSTQSLQSALTLFQQALAQNPNSSEAHFGAAVCLMGADALQVDGGTATGGGGVVTPNAASKSVVHKSAVSREAGSSPGGAGSGFVLPAPPTQGQVPPSPPNGTVISRPIEPVHTLGLFWFLDRGLSNPSTLLNMLAPVSDLHLGLIPYYGYTGDAQEVARRQQLLTDLATVAQHLQIVEADPNFTVTLPAPDQNGQTVTIGLPEVYLFDAYVQSLRVSTALSLAYNRDPGASGLLPPTTGSGGGTGSAGAPTPPAPPIFVGGHREAAPAPSSPFTALDTNGDGKLEPNEYLPASPFLTLRDPSYLQTAQTAMGAIVDRETKGIAGVLARPATGSFLVPNSTDVAAALTSIRDNVLPLIQQATTGPVTLTVPRYQPIPLMTVNGGTTVQPDTTSNELFTTGPIATTSPILPQNTFPTVTTQTLTIDIAAWFAHPPADLKAFAPTYVLDSIGYPNYNLTTYPDPTFGGLFPNGLPTDFLL